MRELEDIYLLGMINLHIDFLLTLLDTKSQVSKHQSISILTFQT